MGQGSEESTVWKVRIWGVIVGIWALSDKEALGQTLGEPQHPTHHSVHVPKAWHVAWHENGRWFFGKMATPTSPIPYALLTL